MLRARRLAFETAKKRAGYVWLEVDLTPAFAEWMANDEYREAYFASPEDLRLKLDAEFPDHMTERIRKRLTSADAAETSVVAAFARTRSSALRFSRGSSAWLRMTSAAALSFSSRVSTNGTTAAFWTRAMAGTILPYRSRRSEEHG